MRALVTRRALNAYQLARRRAQMAVEEGRTPEPVRPLLVHAEKPNQPFYTKNALCGVGCDESMREPFDKESEGSCHRCRLILDREDPS